eukprot:CAMPEP_0168752438 /NCGR_PEP_ID=MMETSP0724-20121128/18385_1 /TAXON_ID=265536 /ORGANISM="Amphiprora sp., Strain CCMP467" /LENGTH=592 /DNA_ID=CAMNT_0008800685 /DNA_START=200 /DNA_END=1975 /DNA_ORIENTATION=-
MALDDIIRVAVVGMAILQTTSIPSSLAFTFNTITGTHHQCFRQQIDNGRSQYETILQIKARQNDENEKLAEDGTPMVESQFRQDFDGDAIEWLVEEDEEEDCFELYDEDDDGSESIASLLPNLDFTSNSTSLLQLQNNETNNNTNPPILLQDFESNLSYFYLKNELGLSEEDMWRITYDAPSALGMTADTIRHKIKVLQETMNLNITELQSIVRRGPALLHLSADKNMAPTILYLLRLLDFSRKELKEMVLACPAILGYKKETLKAKVRFFTDVMRFTVPEARKVLLKEPKLWRASVKTGLMPHWRFLVLDLELNRDVLAHKILARNPRILIYSRDNNLVPKLIFYCIMTLHMEPHHVQKLLTKYPNFLDYNLDRCILPMTRYFLQDLEFSPTEFRAMLLAYPKLVTHSLSKIKYTVGFFRYELGLTGMQVKRVLYQAPQVLGMNDDTLRKKIDYLKQTYGLDEHSTDQGQLQTVLVGMPRLLVLNIENNLQPKVHYLREVFGGDLEALKNAVLRLPTLLAYSLEKRIQPRMEAILGANMDPGSITVGIVLAQKQYESWLHNHKQKIKKKQLQQEAIATAAPMDPSAPIVHW